MATEIKIPLRALNESVIKDLQEKYPEALSKHCCISLLKHTSENPVRKMTIQQASVHQL